MNCVRNVYWESKNCKTFRRIEILRLCVMAVFDNNVGNVDNTCI